MGERLRLVADPPGHQTVVLDGVWIGRVRNVNGEWAASVWIRTPPRGHALTPLDVTFETSAAAVEAVVYTWTHDAPSPLRPRDPSGPDRG